MPNGKILREKERYSAYSTMFTFYIQYVHIPYWKCDICCCLDFIPEKIPYEKTQDYIDI